MGKFRIEIRLEAKKDLAKHLNAANKQSINKIDKIIKELAVTPYTGTVKPE